MKKLKINPFFLLKSHTDLSFLLFFFVFLPLRFQFPTRRHFFPPTGDLLNFRYLGFMQMNKHCSEKTNLPRLKKKREELKIKQFPKNGKTRSPCFLEGPDTLIEIDGTFFFSVICRFLICCYKNAFCKKMNLLI